MKPHVVRFVESILPKSTVTFYREQKRLYLINNKRLEYSKKVAELKGTNKQIKVVFLAIMDSVWKYDSLYWLMENDPMFDPVVLVCPQVNNGEKYMMNQLEETYTSYKNKGYKVICSYNKLLRTFIDIEELQPDILMYTNPYKNLIMSKYYIDHVKNVLSCYVSYYYPKGNDKKFYQLLDSFESLLWKYFSVSEVDRNQIKYQNNVEITGYPMYDAFVLSGKIGVNWKIKDTNHKRIIWAPYHMLSTNAMGVQVSTFIQYADFMLDMANKYKDMVQFVFKPHPLLRPALYNHPDWGQLKTDNYYSKWENGYNTSYTNGEYADLFNTSDAIIHDCGSFTVEYLFVNKPAMYLVNEEYNIIEYEGLEEYQCYTIGRNKDDIEIFIKNLINEVEDTYKERRLAFYNKYLLPPNGCTAAENMLNAIKKDLQ